MSFEINYDNLTISFESWYIVPKIYQLCIEMIKHKHFDKWLDENWQPYLKNYYGLNINVKYEKYESRNRCLYFQNQIEMQLFVLHFM